MKSSKGKGLLGLLAIIAAVAVFGWFGYSSMSDIKLGLDLAGGVSITYQAMEENPTAEQMSDTIYKLQQRVQNYSVESEVYQEGSNRINIDIPGVSDANAILQELGKPGSLSFTDESFNVLMTGDMVDTAKAGMRRSPCPGIRGSAYLDRRGRKNICRNYRGKYWQADCHCL